VWDERGSEMTITETAIKILDQSCERCGSKVSCSCCAQYQSLVALREKADQDKGCEYCNGDIPVLYDTFDSVNGKPVNFCPMCGRRLEKEAQK